MRTVDEILATGRFTDRRGRTWVYIGETDSWAAPAPDDDGDPWEHIEWRHSKKMRLLIERDQHRGVCRGLDSCTSHPVPHVLAGRAHGRFFKVVGRHLESRYGATLTEAIDAARALAVGS